MAEQLKRNWRTTASALVTAVFGFVIFSPELFQSWPWLISLAKYIAAGGLVSLGINAADTRKQ